MTTRRRDYVNTFLSEMGVLLASLLLLRLAAHRWGTAGFGEYMLARRTLTMLELPLLLGMGLAVPRQLARLSEGERRHYLAAASLTVLSAIAAGAAVLLPIQRQTAVLFFGSGGYLTLFRAAWIALIGLLLHDLAYAGFRGRLQMAAANLLQVVNRAVIPLAVLAVRGLGVTEVVLTTGLLWAASGGIALATQLFGRGDLPGRSALTGDARELLAYGLPRVPGEIALSALFALPSTMAVHTSGVVLSGFVSLGVSLVTLVGALFGPIGQVLLPAASRMSARGEVEKLRRQALLLGVGSVALGVVGVGLGELLLPVILPLYIGQDFIPALPYVRIMLLGSIPYAAFMVLRHILDALHVRALNAVNLVVSLGLFLALSLLLPGSYAVANAFVVAMTSLGLTTAWQSWRSLRVNSDPRRADQP